MVPVASQSRLLVHGAVRVEREAVAAGCADQRANDQKSPGLRCFEVLRGGRIVTPRFVDLGMHLFYKTAVAEIFTASQLPGDP